MDPETAAELSHLHGWMDYYEGEFRQAVTWFEQCLFIANESGREEISQNGLHFLGRVYADWGHLAQTKQQAEGWFRQADEKLTAAYQLHLKYGDTDEQGYDVFRQAQLRRMQRQWPEAAHLRERARHLFSNGLLTLSVDLEEATLALQNSEMGPARRKAEEALGGWAVVGHAKGMADALHLLGRSNYVEGKSDQALECYTAALCIYPFEHHLSNRYIWTAIDEIGCREDSNATRRWTRRLRDVAETRQGYFANLNSVFADRSADIDWIFSRLRSRGM
jgi:tetratricopeptide (TPR) repeat protein